MKDNNAQSKYEIPVAIVIAGVLIAAAVIFSGGGSNIASNSVANNRLGNQPSDEFRMPNETDHIRGNPLAPIIIIEFSDLECPFCGRLHPTLSRIIEENDDVAWAYRHFPLNSHTNAFGAAVASECIAKLGGNEAFWGFTDSAFENQRQLGNKFYDNFARSIGIDAEAFASCLKDERVATDVQRDLDEVIAIGGRGTPHSVVITPSGEHISFSGALPYEQIKSLIVQARNN